ncbi:hypothetical protein ATCC53582_01545 [Novacetimonas hansenii]|nr:hypothetical protein ATCC53582_01545 [Novacetimonas hansenii]
MIRRFLSENRVFYPCATLIRWVGGARNHVSVLAHAVMFGVQFTCLDAV